MESERDRTFKIMQKQHDELDEVTKQKNDFNMNESKNRVKIGDLQAELE